MKKKEKENTIKCPVSVCRMVLVVKKGQKGAQVLRIHNSRFHTGRERN